MKNKNYANSKNQCNQNDSRVEIKQKKQRRNIAKTAVLSTVLALFASAIVGLSVALYFSQENVKTHEEYQRQIDGVYSRAYYDLLDGASDLGITLRKIGVSNSSKLQQSLLYDVWNTAQLAEDNLGMFRSNDDGMLNAQKFVNQLGDYSHSLALKLASGKSLDQNDRQTLLALGEIADKYKDALDGVRSNLRDGEMFISEGGALDNFTSAFSDFAEPSFEYPEMIYDGPFSSALESRTPKGISGEEISVQKGAELVEKYFEDSAPRRIEFQGEGNGDIKTFNYTFQGKNGSAFVQIARTGGMLISFNTPGNDDMQTANVEASETCQQSAMSFAKRCGFDDMRVVWSSSAEGECVVNLAPVQNQTVIYPDLVKVKVDENTHSVIGFDASHYAINHCPRTLQTPAISAKQAMANLSVAPITEGRLALIPMRETQEVLTYEFECVSGGTYYIYVDAMTGEEVNILYVIEDEMGERTM